MGNRRGLLLSPNHRVLLLSALAELFFGHHEVLIPAKALIGLAGISYRRIRRARYVHLLLHTHDMLFSEGIASESLFTGPAALETLGLPARAGLQAACPEMIHQPMRLNRPALSHSEARLLLGAHLARNSLPGTARFSVTAPGRHLSAA